MGPPPPPPPHFYINPTFLAKNSVPHPPPPTSDSIFQGRGFQLCQWFKTNKLSINSKKLSLQYFIKILLKMKYFSLMIDNTERKHSIKFLGEMLDKHISWIDHLRTAENKIAKNIGLLYRISQFPNEDSLKTVHFSYIPI